MTCCPEFVNFPGPDTPVCPLTGGVDSALDHGYRAHPTVSYPTGTDAGPGFTAEGFCLTAQK